MLEKELSDVYIFLAVIYLITSDDNLFLESINNVKHKTYLTIKSFWEALYYLEKNDLQNYQVSKENITKNFNLNNKLKKEDQNKLNSYLYILNSLEEKENLKNEEAKKSFYEQTENAGVLVKEYLHKALN